MAYTPTTLALWHLNGSLYDDVANNHFYQNNDDPYDVGPQISGAYAYFNRYNLFQNKSESIQGLNLSNNVSYEADVSNYVNGDFTLGFWMEDPESLGFVRHVVNRSKTPKTRTIIAKGDSTVVDTEEVVENVVFIVREEAFSETTNRIRLILSEHGTDLTNEIVSEAYSPGVHHVLVTYSRDRQQARIDIDGFMGTWQSAPSTLNTSISTIKLNAVNPDYVAHQATDRATILRDIFFKNEAALDETEAERAFNFGVDYVTDNTLVSVEFSAFGFSFTQPNTIRTNAIVVDGSSIYLGRSNGEILKGEQPIWDNVLEFSSDKKNQLLQKSTAGSFTYTDDGVLLEGSFIKV